jgi:hypothetical protein
LGSKIAKNPHILAKVNIDFPDDRYQKLNIYISEIILDSYEYISIACIA